MASAQAFVGSFLASFAASDYNASLCPESYGLSRQVKFNFNVVTTVRSPGRHSIGFPRERRAAVGEEALLLIQQEQDASPNQSGASQSPMQLAHGGSWQGYCYARV